MSNYNAQQGDFQLERDSAGRLELVDAQGIRHKRVEGVRGFPISDPDHHVSICDADGRELVTVRDMSALSPQARLALEENLAQREFVPVIRRILRPPTDSEPAEWEVETDRGPTRFSVKTHEDIRKLGASRALVVDAQGIRYLIDDVTRLDSASRRILERYLG